jgi:hypothetical protein
MPGGDLQLSSVLSLTPFPGGPGGNISLESDIDLILAASSQSQYQLTSATPQAVSFGGLAQATVVRVTCDAGVIDVVVTTVDGASQTIPIDASGKFEWACLAKPITALSLIGQTGQTINVNVFLGTT